MSESGKFSALGAGVQVALTNIIQNYALSEAIFLYCDWFDD